MNKKELNLLNDTENSLKKDMNDIDRIKQIISDGMIDRLAYEYQELYKDIFKSEFKITKDEIKPEFNKKEWMY